jgi:hypothetical protein
MMINTRILASSMLVLSSLAACGGNGSDSKPVGNASVFKSMDTLQCGVGGLSLTALQAQLGAANVQVVSAACGNDGVARPATCGTSDGRIGIFEIPPEKLTAASAAGFTLLSTVPTAKTIACPTVSQENLPKP